MSGGYVLSSFSKTGPALDVRELYVPQSQDMMGMVMSRPHSGRIWDDTLPFCVVPMAGEGHGEGWQQDGWGDRVAASVSKYLTVFTVCTVLPYVFRYLITPCEMVSLVCFYRGGN